MFSGENAPVAYALSWCGWRVEPVDWLLNARHDLSKPEVRRGVAIQVQSCDAAIWAVDCPTLREIGKWQSLATVRRQDHCEPRMK